jgi:hypothetical protein
VAGVKLLATEDSLFISSKLNIPLYPSTCRFIADLKTHFQLPISFQSALVIPLTSSSSQRQALHVEQKIDPWTNIWQISQPNIQSSIFL